MKIFIVLVQWPFMERSVWKVFASRETAEAQIAGRENGEYTIEEHVVI